MESIKILSKTLICIFTICIIHSCEHRNTQREYAEDESIYGDRSEEALKPENRTSTDTTGLQDTDGLKIDENEKHNSSIPPKVYNAIKSDSSLNKQEVVDSRRYEKENTIYYEVLFRKNDKITTVTFDKEGNYSGDYND
ncbi:hypothetical protein ACFSKL_17970 [Belliella marina]|uniref:Lipoprotein n=1 Tax=Belliella marina TaxID=1644146 RepID=A0ABW4VQZ6_9BACT